MLFVGIDAGKFKTKYAYSTNDVTVITKSFSSSLMRYIDMNVDVETSDQDFIIEFNEDKYIGGDLADREQEIGISFTDESKYRETTLINILTALHLTPDNDFKIVVGSPISKRTEEEKQNIINMLKKSHRFTLNGKTKTIHIHDVIVSPEGAAGFYSQPQQGEIQGFDFGSSTTNYFYFSNGKVVARKSNTFPVGDRNSTVPANHMVEEMVSKLSNKFSYENPTMVIGGNAQKMYQYVKKHYPKAFLPQNPMYATVIGFYKIGRSIYGK